MEIVNFVYFTNGFSTKRFSKIPALNACSSSVLLTVFGRNRLASSVFPKSSCFVDFLQVFRRTRSAFSSFRLQVILSFYQRFGRNRVAAEHLLGDENSSIFLQDFDEMGFGHGFFDVFAFRLFS